MGLISNVDRGNQQSAISKQPVPIYLQYTVVLKLLSNAIKRHRSGLAVGCQVVRPVGHAALDLGQRCGQGVLFVK